MTVIYNGVDPALFPHNDSGTHVPPTIVMVGRLVPAKDPLTLLDAVRRLPEARLVYAGDGPLRSRIEASARDAGLDGRVSLLGVRADIPSLLSNYDILALPSLWEGLPFAVIEGMMAGLPVVASRVGGVPELVEHGVTGFLVPAGDAAALADALRTLVNDGNLRRQMGGAGRARAIRQFTAERMVRETLAVYGSLLPRPAPLDSDTLRRVTNVK
jgi:glycosyltransferase involved in cell wall biosynthesis